MSDTREMTDTRLLMWQHRFWIPYIRTDACTEPPSERTRSLSDFMGTFYDMLVFQNGYLSVWGLWLSFYWTFRCIDVNCPTFCFSAYALLIFPLSLFCAVGGAYIAYVYPGHLHLPHLGFVLPRGALMVTDILAHQYPLYRLTRSAYQSIDLTSSSHVLRYRIMGHITVSGLVALYYFLVDWKSRYHLRVHDLLYIYVTWNLLLLFFTLLER